MHKYIPYLNGSGHILEMDRHRASCLSEDKSPRIEHSVALTILNRFFIPSEHNNRLHRGHIAEPSIKMANSEIKAHGLQRLILNQLGHVCAWAWV